MTKQLSHIEISKRGGEANKKNHPDGYFSAIGKKGAQARWKKTTNKPKGLLGRLLNK